jgi:hypothetical protein
MGLVAPHLAVRRGKAVGSGIAEQMKTAFCTVDDREFTAMPYDF